MAQWMTSACPSITSLGCDRPVRISDPSCVSSFVLEYRRVLSIDQYIFIYLLITNRARTYGRKAAMRSDKSSPVLIRHSSRLTGAPRPPGRGGGRGEAEGIGGLEVNHQLQAESAFFAPLLLDGREE